MQWLTHNGERCGVEGDFAIDDDGHLVSDTENLIHIGLVPHQVVSIHGTCTYVVDVTKCRVQLRGLASDRVTHSALAAGPVDRAFVGRLLYAHGDKEI